LPARRTASCPVSVNDPTAPDITRVMRNEALCPVRIKVPTAAVSDLPALSVAGCPVKANAPAAEARDTRKLAACPLAKNAPTAAVSVRDVAEAIRRARRTCGPLRLTGPVAFGTKTGRTTPRATIPVAAATPAERSVRRDTYRRAPAMR